MRTLSRTVVSIAVAIVVSVALSLPASAGQIIEYKGETSAPSYNRVVAYVLKKDSGRRFLRYIAIRSTITCEDASTTRLSAVIGVGRLGKDGSFAEEFKRSEFFARVEGAIGFRHGSGTWLFNRARLTEDGTDAQLCTTGELTWTVERTKTYPAKWAEDVPGGERYLKVRTAGRVQ
jgi:hypothetical protein